MNYRDSLSQARCFQPWDGPLGTYFHLPSILQPAVVAAAVYVELAAVVGAVEGAVPDLGKWEAVAAVLCSAVNLHDCSERGNLTSDIKRLLFPLNNINSTNQI